MNRQDFIWLVCGAFGLNEKQVTIEEDGLYTVKFTVSDTKIDSKKFHKIVSRNLAAICRVVLVNDVGAD